MTSERPPTLRECLTWLEYLQEGTTIWDTDLRYVFRIMDALEMLADEIDVANEAHARLPLKE